MTQKFDEAAATWDMGDVRVATARSIFQTLSSRMALGNSMDILDFGCGTGLLSFQAAPLVRSVTGVDLSPNMVAQLLQKNTSEIQVNAVCQDIVHTPLNQKFHGVISSMALHHVEELPSLFSTFYTHLHRDGFIALADLETEDGTFHSHGNEGIYHFGFDRDALRTLIETAGFKNVRFHEACTITKEEKNYPIFLVIATK
jgi:predicted TPR repeat methyltransferase